MNTFPSPRLAAPSRFFLTLGVLQLVALALLIGCDSAEPEPPQPARLTFAGEVTSTLDYPIPDAMVTLATAEGDTETGVTDSSGAFSIDVPAGSYTLTVNKQGYEPLSDAVAVQQSTTGYAYAAVLQGLASVQGRLMDPRRYYVNEPSPVPNTPIRFLVGGSDVEVITDEQGGFSLEGLPSGTWTAFADGPGVIRGTFDASLEAGANTLGDVFPQLYTPSDGYRFFLTWSDEPYVTQLTLTWRGPNIAPDDYPTWLCDDFCTGDPPFGTDKAVHSASTQGFVPFEYGVTLFDVDDGLYRLSVFGDWVEGVSYPEVFERFSFQVDVYKGQTLLKTIVAPPPNGSNQQGNGAIWRVLELRVVNGQVDLIDSNGQSLGYVHFDSDTRAL